MEYFHKTLKSILARHTRHYKDTNRIKIVDIMCLTMPSNQTVESNRSVVYNDEYCDKNQNGKVTLNEHIILQLHNIYVNNLQNMIFTLSCVLFNRI